MGRGQRNKLEKGCAASRDTPGHRAEKMDGNGFEVGGLIEGARVGWGRSAAGVQVEYVARLKM